jgi:hypothetical protein
MAGVIVLDKREQFPSMVLRDGDRLELDMLVASGHMDRNCTAPITERHLVALHNHERYLLLFAALHHPFQLPETELDAAGVTTYLDTILLGPEEAVNVFLTDLDHGQANGAISNLVHLCSRADIAPMRAGTWFQETPGS